MEEVPVNAALGGGVRVRLAAVRDASALAEMNLAFNGVRIRPAAIGSNLGRGTEIVAVAQDGGALVGFACAQVCHSFCYPRPYAELTELYVEADSRRAGVATRLVEFVEEQLARRRVGHIHILTGVRNRPARKLYEGLGYKRNPERPETLYEKDLRRVSPPRPRS